MDTDMDKIMPSLISRLGQQKAPLTVKELSELLRISKRTAYNMIENQGLPAIKIGSTLRVDPVHAAKWLRSRTLR